MARPILDFHFRGNMLNYHEMRRYTDFRQANPRRYVRIHIPKEVTQIPYEAFYKDSCLREVVFESGSRLREVCVRSFHNSGLEKINLEVCKRLHAIGDRAFMNCSRLKELAFDIDLDTHLAFRRNWYGRDLQKIMLNRSQINVRELMDPSYDSSGLTIFSMSSDIVDRLREYILNYGSPYRYSNVSIVHNEFLTDTDWM